ncbi:MAG: ORF6N domain-containing protein [Candidatus Bipolaricaulis sp.]|nr:ORF6N domain-containing protein [Candidatus Bipolaricaulis sp.]
MLDADFAVLYGVEVRAPNQAAKRNIERFPPDFTFRLTAEEALLSRSQLVIVKGEDSPPGLGSSSQSMTARRGADIKYRPNAFTEQGVAMLSSTLRSTAPSTSTSRSCEASYG